MSSTIEHWAQVSNLDEILARSRARHAKNPNRSKALSATQGVVQDKSTYLENWGTQRQPEKVSTYRKLSTQTEWHSKPGNENTESGQCFAHSLAAINRQHRYNKPLQRKIQHQKGGTDLYHSTSRDIARQKTESLPHVKHGLPDSVDVEDLYRPKPTDRESQARQLRKLKSVLGINGEHLPSKPADYPHPGTQVDIQNDWDLFDFELEEAKPRQDVLEPVEAASEIPQILEFGTPLPIELPGNVSGSQSSQAVSKKSKNISSQGYPANKLLVPAETHPIIQWSQSPKHSSKTRSYIATMRSRYHQERKACKRSASRPAPNLNCPREITLTLPSQTPSPVSSRSNFIDPTRLMPPPNLYKKKQRRQQILNDRVYAKELRVRRLSLVGLSNQDFAVRRQDIMHEGKLVFDD